MRNGLNFNEKTDIYIDIISGFKEGEARPQYSILKNKVEAGLYQQILFSEFSRLDRKPSNLLKSIEYYQSKNVWLWFGKQVHLRYVQVRLVIQLCIRKFTGYDLRRKAMTRR